MKVDCEIQVHAIRVSFGTNELVIHGNAQVGRVVMPVSTTCVMSDELGIELEVIGRRALAEAFEKPPEPGPLTSKETLCS